MFYDLDHGTEYTFEVRAKATESSFHGEAGTATSTTEPSPGDDNQDWNPTPGWDDDHTPIPPVHVEGDDDTPVELMCAAVAALAILVVVFVWADRRRS